MEEPEKTAALDRKEELETLIRDLQHCSELLRRVTATEKAELDEAIKEYSKPDPPFVQCSKCGVCFKPVVIKPQVTVSDDEVSTTLKFMNEADMRSWLIAEGYSKFVRKRTYSSEEE